MSLASHQSTISHHWKPSPPVYLLKTLCQRDIKYSPNLKPLIFESVADFKSNICSSRNLFPDEILLISNGKECLDSDPVPSVSSLILKSNATRCVEVTIKIVGTKKPVTISVPLNMRVSQLKTYLVKQNLTKWSVGNQRLIACSMVMKDHNLLGDYIIHQKGSSLILHLSQTINSRTEIEIRINLRNNQEIKFYLECGLPLYYAKDILQKQFGIPLDLEYHFQIQHNAMHLTDMNKCLLDYGILPSVGKKIKMFLCFDSKFTLPTSSLQVIDINSILLNSKNNSLVEVVSAAHTTRGKQICHPLNLKIVTKFENDSHNTGYSSAEKQEESMSGHIFSSSNIKKKPSGKKSPTCRMFGGMKKGFLSGSSSSNRQNRNSKKN